MYPLKSTGIIRYDPDRGDMKRRTDWWCVVETCPGIPLYYTWLLTRSVPGLRVARGAWGSHISVIRGERPPRDKMHLWKKYDGQRVEFTYDILPVRRPIKLGQARGDVFFIHVHCQKLIDIRNEFGFPSDWRLHLTICRTYDDG